MDRDQQIERLVREEFKQTLPMLIWQNEDGDYEAFGKYII